MKVGRLRLAPINTGFYSKGLSTNENSIFFTARAAGGVDLCLVGNIAISADLVPNSATGIMSTSMCWTDLASAIRRAGSVPGIQLSATLPNYKGQRKFYNENPESEIKKYRTLFSKLPKKFWKSLQNRFVQAIYLSWHHGFEHVQIHAAHGYAFSLALDPLINPDGLGVDVLSSLMGLLAKHSPKKASLRVSWQTGLPYDSERQRSILIFWERYQNQIELDLSNGYYNVDKRLIYPPHTKGEAPFFNNAVLLAKKYPEASIVLSGNIWNPYNLIEFSPSNLNFALARSLIADPSHLIKIKRGISMSCNDCDDCHYYSNGTDSISCSQWSHPQTRQTSPQDTFPKLAPG